MTSKRIFDIIFSVTFILLFSWLYLIIGLIILINYGLPIIYSAERVGYNKKTFICISNRLSNWYQVKFEKNRGYF